MLAKALSQKPARKEASMARAENQRGAEGEMVGEVTQANGVSLALTKVIP